MGAVSVILPMYNEEKSIPQLRAMFDSGIELPAGCDFDIIVVNDGSEDATLELANLWAKENSRVSIVSHRENLGLGQAILTGFGESIKKGSIITVTMDADATHPGSIIYDLVSKLLEGYDIVIASRYASGGKQVGLSWERRLFSLGARYYLSLFFPLKGVRDYTCGFRAYKTELLSTALANSRGHFLVFNSFTAMVEILLKVAVIADCISEVPLILRYDLKQGGSKLKLWGTLRDYLRLVFLPQEKCLLGKGLRK